MPSPRPSSRLLALRDELEELHQRYHRPEYLATDPLLFAHRYPAPGDREVVALIAAAFASGNIKSIQAHLSRLLQVMGPRPAQWLAEQRPRDLQGRFAGIGHRWARDTDVEVLAAILGEALRRHGSLGALWKLGDDPASADTTHGLANFSAKLMAMPIQPLVSRTRSIDRADGRRTALAPVVSILLTSPAGGSACKRMNLFLRWMARPADGIDLGLWTSFLSPSRLLMPVDVHVLRICRRWRFTRRRMPDARTVQEITARFRLLNPEDPCRYDFALVRVGTGG